MRRNRTSLANWQDPHNTAWSYRHVRELIPTARIGRGEHVSPLHMGSQRAGLPVERLLQDESTDGVIVLHDDAVVLERYQREMQPDDVHLLQSVSKAIAGTVAGVLAACGALAINSPVTDYLPELTHTSFEGASVRDLLDMRTGTRFDETYDDPSSDVSALEAQFGWAPAPRPSPDAISYLTSLSNCRSHGGRFEYRSVLTDLLGLVIERASGVPFAETVGHELWSPIGAETDAYVTVDADGVALADGGICVSLRDLARFGRMVLDDGTIGDRRVIPSEWLTDTLHGGEDSAQAFAQGQHETSMAGGHYRNQWWVPAGGRTLIGSGIHGQFLFVDRQTRTVIALLATWPVPWDDQRAKTTAEAFAATAAALSERPGVAAADVV